MGDLSSIVTSRTAEGGWQCLHVPSGKRTVGLTPDEAQEAMHDLLGVDQTGAILDAPLTSIHFEGKVLEIARFVENEISQALALHAGYARLIALDEGIAMIHLGGGCKGCPSSALTLLNGVRSQLIERFSGFVHDVVPASE